MDVSTVYDRPFFEAHLPWRGEYALIAEALARRFAFSSVLDLGCGNGFLIARLAELGKAVAGIDGSAHAVELSAPAVAARIEVMDLSRPLWTRRRDLVICSEVAEHLAARHADTLVDNICVNSRDLVFFTAATPGQGGHFHINEQPHQYWIDKFRLRCFQVDEESTKALRQDLAGCIRALWWFTRNAVVFRAE